MHPEAARVIAFIRERERSYLEQRLSNLEHDIRLETERRSSWALGIEYCYQEMAYFNRKEQSELYRGKWLSTIKHFEAWERFYNEKMKTPDPRKWMEEVCQEIRKILGTTHSGDAIQTLKESSSSHTSSPPATVTATRVSPVEETAVFTQGKRKVRFIED